MVRCLRTTVYETAYLFSRPAVLQVTYTPSQPGWRRPRGSRRISWLRQVCIDLTTLANLALDGTSWIAVAAVSGLGMH